MLIPVGFGHVTHVYAGAALPFGAVVTYGIDQPPELSAADLASELHGLWGVSTQNFTYVGADLVETRVKLGPNEDGPTATWGAVFPGEGAAQAPPPNVSTLVRKNTALGGRRNRGRLYAPFAGEADFDGAGNLAPLVQADIQEGVDGFLTAITLLSIGMVILHTSGSGIPTEVVSLAVDGRAATQRRRLRR